MREPRLVHGLIWCPVFQHWKAAEVCFKAIYEPCQSSCDARSDYRTLHGNRTMQVIIDSTTADLAAPKRKRSKVKVGTAVSGSEKAAPAEETIDVSLAGTLKRDFESLASVEAGNGEADSGKKRKRSGGKRGKR